MAANTKVRKADELDAMEDNPCVPLPSSPSNGQSVGAGKPRSKQAMARRLVELGSEKSFNTLRKYDAGLLMSMVASAEGTLAVAVLETPMAAGEPTVVQPVEVIPVAVPYIPTDAELMSVRCAAPVAVPAAARSQRLSLAGVVMLPVAWLFGW